MKSERLKKLETELGDLEQWLLLGLVPKKEIERHKEEIENLKAKIGEEKNRLNFLKESGEIEEFTTPKRVAGKPVYQETPTMSDIEINEGPTETEIELPTTVEDEEVTKEEGPEEVVEEEDPFSDKNRWSRGGIIDPDATEW